MPGDRVRALSGKEHWSGHSELAPPVIRRERRDLGRAESLEGDNLDLEGLTTNKRRETDFEQGRLESNLGRNQSSKSGQLLLRTEGKEDSRNLLQSLGSVQSLGRNTPEAPATPVSILSAGGLHSPVGEKPAHHPFPVGVAWSSARARCDAPDDDEPARRCEELEQRIERVTSWVEESPTGGMDEERLKMEDRGSSSDNDSIDTDLASVRSSFEMGDDQRPSFDFTSEFKGEFRPLPTMVPETSQNLEGFADMASETMSGDLDTPSTSSQEFMQMVSDQVDGKMSRSRHNVLLNLIGQGSGALEDEAELILYDHETAEQFVRASLRTQLLYFSLVAIASMTVAGFMLSLLFSSIKINSQLLSEYEGQRAHPPSHGHDWWIFGSMAGQGLVTLLAVLITALVGAYVTDNRRAVQKAQHRAERREQDDLLASRRSERRAMERAKTATRAKQQFMAYVFHNIRVPFNAIVLGLGHMRAAEFGESLPGDKMDLIQMMLDCAETMTSVLDDVTDMSQWEDNKLDLRTDNFDLLAVVRFLSWGLRDLLDQKNINFGMVIDPRARAVLSSHKTVGDKHRVVQVLGQFLSNAVKLTPRNGEINLVMACEDLEWIEEEQLGAIGWRIVRTERKPSRNSSSHSKHPLSDDPLYTSPSMSVGSDPMSSAEEMLPRKVSLTPRAKKSGLGMYSPRRRSRQSFERPSGGDPFVDLPAVQRVDSDDVESGGADSEPGGSDSAAQTSPREEDNAPEASLMEKRSPRMEANKPTQLQIPGETSGAGDSAGAGDALGGSLKTPGGSLSAPSPAGPFEMARIPSITSSTGSGVNRHESLPAMPPMTPKADPTLDLATTSSPSKGRSRRTSLDSATTPPDLTADIAAALASGYSGWSGAYGLQDRIGGVKLSRDAINPASLAAGIERRMSSGGITPQLSAEGDEGGQLEVRDGKTKDEMQKEIRKQRRKGLNETILQLKGGELEGDRGRRPTPRRKVQEARRAHEQKRSFEVEVTELPPEKEKNPLESSHESLSPSGSGRMQSSKSLAQLPIVGFATIRISVKDTGPAITEEEQEKLFEPYSRIATGCMQRAGVSTLGLSLAKRFVRQVGGSIGVDTQTPNGNCFWFSVPFPLVAEDETANDSTASLASSDVEKTSDPGSSEAGPPATPPQGMDAQNEVHRAFTEKLAKKLSGGTQTKTSAVGRALHQAISRSLSGSLRGDLEQMSELRRQLSVEKEESDQEKTQAEKDANDSKRKVLLVEDTEINRIIMRKVLQNLGLLCDEAENGKVAVDLLKQGRNYDLILMDKEMPVMDGHEATRLLRQMGVKTPIIALTGNALKSDRELFFKAGVDEFQTKPLSRDKLVHLLVRLGWKKEQLGKGEGNVFSPKAPPRKAAGTVAKAN
ncbi:Putative histidine kinase containing cheY-homologous receiver domain [Klebsormidium nitens]|uniref:histidine kinase n=1 Tax=Klebsormidium nitens TaxID=105231 RepID=A0A1Y1HMT7_KLENI|nr:Putative histidine kinase containing cheY-homologous receiver domain [Klebsormidium nitens]|eukprot:GAQ79945.1 Putative histidine kinase containing cheY-homologous receiver domain [Klebsormidium nitens]